MNQSEPRLDIPDWSRSPATTRVGVVSRVTDGRMKARQRVPARRYRRCHPTTTRLELLVAVYRHHVETRAAAGPRLLAESETPEAALRAWVKLFVEFLVTKHSVADALQTDAYKLFKGIGNLCIGAANDVRYEPEVLVQLLISGALREAST
ncbi:hypothetical protein [Microbacterium oleivorans]|uniref:hypothetical protein n=1 Tax=Microbacterium oleivorans TaxID=273677 RepID=UPI001C4A2CC0|nr:hypothetical protein [Microbacterium oleivorans]